MAQAYTAPDWSTGEGISPSNLQSISNVLEGIVQGTDKAIHKFDIYGSYIELTYVDGTVGGFETVGLKGIRRIDKTSSGGIDTYTIIYTDGTTYSFEVVNGASLEVVDRLDSTDKKSALSANQGRVLNESKADKSEVEGLIEDLTQTNATLKAMSTMTSSDDLDYSIEGNIESARFEGYARKSKNLLDFNAFKNVSVFNGTKNVTDNSITLTATADDCYTSHVISSFPAIISAKSGDVITLSFDRNNTNSGSVHIWSYNESKGNGQLKYQTFNTQGRCSMSYTVPQNGFITIRLGVSTNGQSITYSNIMVEKSSSATAYEPYGIIKPSGVVESIGKNLLDKKTDAIGYIETSTMKIVSQSTNRYAYAKIKPNTTYTISKKVGKAFRVGTSAVVPTDGVSVISTVADHTGSKMTVTSESNANYLIVMYWGNGTEGTPEDMLNSLMVEEGASATNYQPYETDSITLPYIPLGVNDIKDELIVYADGTGKFIKRVEQVDLGSLNWSNSANYWSCTDYGAKAKTVDASATPNLICETLEAYKSSTIASVGKGTNYMAVYHTNGNLIATPTESPKGLMIYELATPQEIALTAEEVAQILALKTFAEVTYIDADGLAYEIGYLFNSAKAIKDLKETLQSLINVAGGIA